MSDLKLFIPEKAPSHRQSKVAEIVRQILSKTCLERDFPPFTLEDGTVKSFNESIIITKVTISADLTHATAYFMTQLGKNLNFSKDYLNHVRSHFRYILGKNISLKKVPTVQFEIDKTFDTMDEMDKIFKKITPS
jgi:ribosome-binding factor A